MSLELPRSAISVLSFLDKNGPMAPREISRKSKIPLRTVTFALKRLLEKKLCRRVPNLSDMRRPKYHADAEKAKTVFMRYGRLSNLDYLHSQK